MKRKRRNKTNVVIYQAKNGQIEFRGDFERDTIWGTQKQIADVFDIDRSVVTRHINKIMQDGEVEQKSNVQKMHIANSDKPVNFYSQWKNFKTVIDKARTACEMAEHRVSNHFAGVGKTIKMPKGAEKTIDDFMLTRYACYLTAQNGSPCEKEIAFETASI